MSNGETLRTYQDYFKNFVNQHETAELRLAAARSLVDSSIEQPNFSQGGHRFLVAHWGEDIADLEQIAVSMYERKGAANRSLVTDTDRRHVIAITEGRTDTVNSDEPVLGEPITLEMGRIAETGLFNQFGGRVHAIGTVCRGVPAPYLNFRQSLLVTDYQRLRVVPDGEIQVTPIPRDFDESYINSLEIAGDSVEEDEDDVPPEVYLPKLTAYLGTVSLQGNRPLYDHTKNLVERELIFGNVAAYEFIKALAEKASLRAKFAFAALERSGTIAIGQPLPNLSYIFGKRARITEPVISAQV